MENTQNLTPQTVTLTLTLEQASCIQLWLQHEKGQAEREVTQIVKAAVKAVKEQTA